MAISEVPKIKDENFDKLNVAEDSKLILSLLHEYSEKLLKVCEQSEQTTISWNPIILSISIGILFSFIFSYFAYLPSRDLNGLFRLSSILWTITLLLNYLIYRGSTSQRQLNILKNSRRIATRLERIINIGSQFNEQITTNFASRIEFDFRLADAEEILERYTYLSKKYRKFDFNL